MFEVFEMLMKLIFAHALTDMAFQTSYISFFKSPFRKRDPEDVPWLNVMAAHSLINGAGVYLVTGIVWLGLLETLTHFAIDCGSCSKMYGNNIDQLLHLWTKLIWLCWWMVV